MAHSHSCQNCQIEFHRTRVMAQNAGAPFSNIGPFSNIHERIRNVSFRMRLGRQQNALLK